MGVVLLVGSEGTSRRRRLGFIYGRKEKLCTAEVYRNAQLEGKSLDNKWLDITRGNGV